MCIHATPSCRLGARSLDEERFSALDPVARKGLVTAISALVTHRSCLRLATCMQKHVARRHGKRPMSGHKTEPAAMRRSTMYSRPATCVLNQTSDAPPAVAPRGQQLHRSTYCLGQACMPLHRTQGSFPRRHQRPPARVPTRQNQPVQPLR